MRLREANLKLHPDKCKFMSRQVKYLGYKISEKETEPSDEKTEVVRKFVFFSYAEVEQRRPYGTMKKRSPYGTTKVEVRTGSTKKRSPYGTTEVKVRTGFAKK